MFRDILVHVPSTQSPRPVIDYSISLAADVNARIDAVAFGYEPITADLSYEGAGAVAAVIDIQHERALEQAKSVLSLFEREAKLSKIQYACRAYSLLPADINRTIGEWSRLHDLTVVSQPEPGNSAFDELVPEAVLANSGGPVILVPYIHQGPFKARRIAICWDGSRPAARALKDSMQFLEQAGAVDVLAVNEDGSESEASSSDLIAYLARRKVVATARQLTADRADIHNALLSAAADYCAELLVMGAYGHSRLREAIFGGVTRSILRSMTVPVLMSR